MTLQAVPFTYVGDDTDNRAISFAGSFTPQFVLIKAESTGWTAMWWQGIPANNTILSYAAPMYSNLIVSVGSGVVTISNDLDTSGLSTRLNASGAVYHGIVLYDDTGDYLTTGSYTGNGDDNRTISTGESWTPDQVMVKRGAGSAKRWRSSLHSGDSSQTWVTAAGANQIQAFGAGSFEVGSDVSVNAAIDNTDFYWIAIRDCPGVFDSFQYTGNATDNTDISTLSLTPNAFVLIKELANGRQTAIRLAGHVGDESQLHNAVLAANIIQSVITDGFQIGTHANVNTSAATYNGFAIREALSISLVGPTIEVTPGTARLDLATDLGGTLLLVTPGVAQVDLGLLLDSVSLELTPGTLSLAIQVQLESVSLSVTPGSVTIDLDENFLILPSVTLELTPGILTVVVVAPELPQSMRKVYSIVSDNLRSSRSGESVISSRRGPSEF